VTPTTTPTRMTAWLEQAWMVRYLDRQLAGEEANWFEAYALDKPELLAMIEADTRLRDALAADASIRHMERSIDRGGRQGGATGDMPSGVSEPTPLAYARDKSEAREKTQAEARSTQHRRAPVWLAMAATLVLGLGLGFVGTRSLAPDSAAPELIASPTRIVYDTMRGEPTPPRVEHADSKSAYVLIEVAVPDGARDINLIVDQFPPIELNRSAEGFVSALSRRSWIKDARTMVVQYELRETRMQQPLALTNLRSDP